ncbi:diguanylate cyclase (GGDEF) domain-containing protein [Nitrosomonas sp. Nm51]|uniref:HDOD domain-containing protein n=1 Tax=Nitrosomonas sp. Nm51 TaxID=133720 RepID=UPI0008AB1F90|nr:HDOD domain-containing protein [Nitrosomonas sp. Nm51]SER61386.1 diguanylate cyclase (GGDEF) domain-containing protein [Nitrosomonas sp. Nm51]
MKIADIDQLGISELLPSPGGIALALMTACRKENVSIGEITKLIQTDPALSGRLIKKANMASQSTRKITSVPEAIARVGLNAVKQLAMGFSLIDQYQKGTCNRFDYQEFWSHSLLMAIASQELVKSTRLCSPDELFACGLMARIGCLALATAYPERYSKLLEKQSPDSTLAELEKQYLQTNHHELAAAILNNYGFPKIFVESVYYHETPQESCFSEGSRPYQIVHLLYMAKLIADFGVCSASEQSQYTSELILLGGKMSLDTESLGFLIDQIIKDWQTWGELLKVPAAGLPSFHKIINNPIAHSETTEDKSALRILIAEDDPSSLVLVEELLSNVLGHTVFSAANGKTALSLSLEVQPHIVVTDWLMPEMDGLKLTQSLRATDWGQNLYIIMMTGLDDEEEIIEAFDAGVDDYVTKPINIREFRARMRAAWHYRKLQESWERDHEQLKRFAAELAVTNRKLEHIALTDMLTELPNRRAGTEALTKAWSDSSRSNQKMYVTLIDIDHFKRINDTYGHAIGDQVLKKVAATFGAIGRKNDVFFRIGGEEFMAIHLNDDTNAKSAVLFAERLRQHVAALQINIDAFSIQISISMGIAIKEQHMKNEDQLLSAADKALYAAKKTGRNKTCLFIHNKIVDCNHCISQCA